MSARANVSRGVRFRLAQIGRDPGLRSSPIWLVVTALNVSAATGVLVFRATRASTGVAPTSLLIVLWMALALFLVASRGRARCSRLDLTLPLSSRELWLSHLGATLLASLGALGVSIGVLVANERLIGVGVAWQSVIGRLIAGLVLVVVVMQSYQPELREPRRGRFNLVMLAALGGVLALFLLLSRWPLGASLLLLAGSLVLGVRTLGALPPTLATVSRDPAPVRPALEAERSTRESARSHGWRTLFSILHHAPPWGRFTPWVLYGFMLLIGFVMAGGLGLFSDFFDERVLRFIYLPLASYGLFSGLGVLLYQSFRVDPLPVSRRRLFALLMLPTLGVFLLGFVGARLALLASSPRQLVDYRLQGEYYWVDVPLRFLTAASQDEVPTIEAPWGESHLAWSAPLFDGSEMVVYSPFNTAEESSVRFEGLMLSRAVEAIYGRAIPPAELLERYFHVREGRLFALKEDRLTLLADYPGLVAPSDGPEAPIYAALVVIPWLLVSAIFFWSFRSPSSERRVKRVYWAIMILLLSLMIALATGMVTGLYDPEVASALLGIWIRQLGELPLVHVAAWLLAAALGLVAYLFAERQYRRSELPSSPFKLSLIDFVPGDS
jgi:hypothetical protein